MRLLEPLRVRLRDWLTMQTPAEEAELRQAFTEATQNIARTREALAECVSMAEACGPVAAKQSVAGPSKEEQIARMRENDLYRLLEVMLPLAPVSPPASPATRVRRQIARFLGAPIRVGHVVVLLLVLITWLAVDLLVLAR